MTVVTSICLGMLAVSGVLCVIRMLRGPSVPDRIVALDTLLVVIVSGVAVRAGTTGSGAFLDLTVVAALVAYAATVALSRYLAGRSRS